jgi:uncharacterized protein YcbK (DUF882 family)
MPAFVDKRHHVAMVCPHSCFNKRGLTIRNDSWALFEPEHSVPGTNQQPIRRRVLSILDRTEIVRRFEGIARLKWLGCLVVAAIVSLSATAPASAQTRSLKLYFIHTKERAEITYMRNGRYDQRGLNEVNRFLRDWRRNEPAKMDPKVLDLLWEVYRSVGASDYIHVVSAYRSPATNSMLRNRSSGVAKNSQHTLGKAIDFYIPGIPISKIRAAGFRAEGGGVGFYPKSGSPFVHLDVGNVRSWPRMNRSELMALFPDGRTIHVPSDGKPLPGYEQAMAAYKSRQRSGASVQIASASSDSSSERGGSGGGLLATLFGGNNRNNNANNATAAAAPVPAAAVAASRPAPAAEPAPARNTPETIIAALPARSVPVPGAAPRPTVDIGAAPTAPLIADMPQAQQPVAPAAEETAVALNMPIPTRRPDYSPAPAVQVAAAETPSEDLPISAIAGDAQRGGGSNAISEMLAMTATEARADVIINAPVPSLRPRIDSEEPAGLQVAALPDASDASGDVFVLASLPSTERTTISDGPIGDLPPAALGMEPRKQGSLASVTASPRVAVMGRAAGSDAVAALDSGVRTTGKSSKPRAADARPDRRSVAVPVEHELTRWAFQRDVTVANAGGSAQPAAAHQVVWSAPQTVYTAGFQRNTPSSADVNRFTGKAVTFLPAARFATN